MTRITDLALLVCFASLMFANADAFWWSSSSDDDSGESTARSGWSSWLEIEDSSDESDSSVELEDLVLTISLGGGGPPKTAKPTTFATTTTDSPTTTRPKPKPPKG